VSSIANTVQAPISPARTSIDRAVDGVIAGYIRALAHSSASAVAKNASRPSDTKHPCAKHRLSARPIRRRHGQLLALTSA
jgi:hypothetical protein